MPNNANALNTTPPMPIPNAVASPALRDRPTELRATTIKLGPGLIAPITRVPRILATAASGVMKYLSKMERLKIGGR
ncbi:hypothetical protein PBS_54240 [Paraburkholderia sp. 2C]